MQFKLTFSLPHTLSLPLSYHHLVQAFIYRILEFQPEYSAFLHDDGYFADNHNYKLFTYSLLQGTYQIQAPHIIFHDSVSLEVRSSSPEFCDVFLSSVNRKTDWNLNHTPMILESVLVTHRSIKDTHLTIRMLSPITISKTTLADGKKKPVYLTPQDSDFSYLVNENFAKKYQAAYDTQPDSKIYLEPYKVSARDKYVTQFKGIYITAWKGMYRLSGSPQYLDFLYNNGIGSHNSQGFGLFEFV